MRSLSRQSVMFEGALTKPTVVRFDGEAQSSDGGLVLLRAADERLGLTERLAASLVDERQAKKVLHSFREMFQQRVFAIAAGYADCNDAGRVGRDPLLKEACGRRALSGEDLASQPTLSRFENSVTGRELVAMSRDLENLVIARHRKRRGQKARLITIDLDPTEDPTHGQQTFSFFHGHYDSWCFLPLLGFLTFDDEEEQFLFHARLRPGNARDWRTAYPLLRRVVPKLREAFPRARIRVRLDAGFARTETLELLDELGVEFAVSVPGYKALLHKAESLLGRARKAAEKTGETAQVYGEVRYRARKWSRSHRVVVKAEVLVGKEAKDNPRFVVTNMSGDPEDLYKKIYCKRGETENRIKELHALELGRTSCPRFLANALRVLCVATAYVLYQELRLAARGTELARAQVPTLRERLVKIGARVVQSVRRLVLHFPAAYPWQPPWRAIAVALGAEVR
jgi:hypothetical protein